MGEPKPVKQGTNTIMLSLARFEEELQEVDVVFALVGNELSEDVEVPEEAVAIVREFQDVFPEELLEGLPLLRDIQHQIDLEPLLLSLKDHTIG